MKPVPLLFNSPQWTYICPCPLTTPAPSAIALQILSGCHALISAASKRGSIVLRLPLCQLGERPLHPTLPFLCQTMRKTLHSTRTVAPTKNSLWRMHIGRSSIPAGLNTRIRSVEMEPDGLFIRSYTVITWHLRMMEKAGLIYAE